jgi:hypothetical protein
MDDDDVAKPSQLSTLVRVAELTDADIVTSAGDVFSHPDVPHHDEDPVARVLPLGPALGVGLFSNCFGAANALVRRSAFERVDGFTEDWGVGFEDWEFFANAAFAGLRHEVVAEPLFWHRTLPGGIASTTNRTANLQRVLRPYFRHTPPQLHGLLRVSQGSIAGYIPSTDAPATTVPSLARFDLYWDSTSWRITRPLRQLKRRRRGLPPETRPQPQTNGEVDALIQGITTSLSWKLTIPVRVAGRVRRALAGKVAEGS